MQQADYNEMMMMMTATQMMTINIGVAANYDYSSCHQAYVLCARDCLIHECIMLEACADMACMTQDGKAIET